MPKTTRLGRKGLEDKAWKKLKDSHDLHHAHCHATLVRPTAKRLEHRVSRYASRAVIKQQQLRVASAAE